MIKSTLLLCVILLLGCADKDGTEKLVLASNNPFSAAISEPIAYANVTADHIEAYVDVTISNAERDLDIIKTADRLSFENTFKIYDGIVNDLTKASNNAFMLYWVSPDSLIRVKGLSGNQKIESFFTDMGSDKAIYDTFQTYANSDEGKLLTGSKKILITKVLDGFEHSGVNLSPMDLETYKRLSVEVNELSATFSTNMNSAKETLILTEKQSEGLPENFKDTYRSEEGHYKVPIINATSGPVMNNVTSSEVRKAYTLKKQNIAADNNLSILDSLISKRHQIGKTMGSMSYAEYSLKPKMAKTPERVWEFVNGLIAESKEKALKDIEVIKTVRNTEMNTPNDDSPINPWDSGYYINQLLKTKYQLDTEKMRDYFPMEACLEGMFSLYQDLLGLDFKKVENASVWHEEVTMYEVFENGTLKGRFYLDLYPRANKETWFYAVPFGYGKQMEDGYDVPVAMLLGNFTKPTDNLPSLLSFWELGTLFHEFGHIVNSMSYEGEFVVLSRTKPDFVEAMSQIFENWIDDYDIISAFAKHYKTGEVFPKTLFESKQNAKTVASGLKVQRSLRACLYDLNLYDNFNPMEPLDTDQLWKDIDAQMGVMDNYVEGTHPQASWIHINTNPVYMYGYLWSEVYAQDMFTVFEKNGLRDTETGMRYRKLILANGAQRDVDNAVEEFIGRPSNNKAYIKSLGLE